MTRHHTIDAFDLDNLQDAGRVTRFEQAGVYVIKNLDGTSYAVRDADVDYTNEDWAFQAAADAERAYEHHLETRFADQIAWEDEQERLAGAISFEEAYALSERGY